MEKYGVNGKLVATAGRGEELLGYLLEAAAAMEQLDTCDCYVVGINPEEADAVYVFEVWESPEAHAASLQMDVFADLIAKAKPILADMESYPDLTIRGGKARL